MKEQGKMEHAKREKRECARFFCVFAAFSVVLFFMYYGERVNKINATMLAFSYKYGFISRGFIGSVYQLLDKILPGNQMKYAAVMQYTMVITWMFYALMFFFFYQCYRAYQRQDKSLVQNLMIFLVIFAVPTFCAQWNFGRLDVYLVMLSMIGAVLILKERAEWLVVLLAAVCVMIHQGYVFMYANIVLVLFFYKALSNEGKKSKKYWRLFLSTFAVVSVLFLWFEFFSHVNGEAIYEDIVAVAESLCEEGKYHSDVIDHEILGVDLSKREWTYHLQNFLQLPFFLILFSPYLVLGTRYFRNVVRQAKTAKDKFKYLAVAVGAATLLPDFILKVDYGRWVLAFICYYVVVVLVLLALGDEIMQTQMQKMVHEIKGKYSYSALLLAYPLLLTPFRDVAINRIAAVLASYPNEWFFHFW